jgi:diguanylate cyclase (GGDEF)-like protein
VHRGQKRRGRPLAASVSVRWSAFAAQLRRAGAAERDPVTGLGTLAAARAALAPCYRGQGEDPAVVLVHLDGIASVNATFGHAYGDALLRLLADRLRACAGGPAVARLSGEEFVAVVRDLATAESLAHAALNAVRGPLVTSGSAASVAVHVGVARTACADGADEALRHAALAADAARSAGPNRVAHYHPVLQDEAARRVRLHRALRGAIDSDALSLHYQPIVRLPDGAVVGAEALLRWHDRELGVVSPEVFVPLAEESGLIVELDAWVLDRACRDIVAWRTAGLDVPRVSVNVSRRHMTAELPDLVADVLRRHDLPGDALCLEVTESAVAPDADVAVAALSGVRALGVSVALDDFGTGQSSLSQLARLPVDSVKIDRSFILDAASDPVALRLLTSVVGVCQALDLPVVAEGIEKGQLAQFLAAIGCVRGQGFHFARPQPAASFLKLLGQRAAVPSPRSAAVLPARAPGGSL